MIPSYSRNAVFTCRSKIYGDCVLKIERQGLKQSYTETEYRFLEQYTGQTAGQYVGGHANQNTGQYANQNAGVPFCMVYAADFEKKIILEERIFPGVSLWSIPSRAERTEIFCSLYHNLHQEPFGDNIGLPGYIDWLDRRIRYMSRYARGNEEGGQKSGRQSRVQESPRDRARVGAQDSVKVVEQPPWQAYVPDMAWASKRDSTQAYAPGDEQDRDVFAGLYETLCRAKELYLGVSDKYPRKMFLHGDIHNGNILIDSQRGYIIIDPKGVIGDPVLDVSRFILEEFNDAFTYAQYSDILSLTGQISKKLDIPIRVLLECLYIEVAIWVCWNLEDGESRSDIQYLLDNITILEDMLT